MHSPLLKYRNVRFSRCKWLPQNEDLCVCIQDVSGCNASPVEGADSGDSSLSYICSALSQDDGTFAFPSLASGAYTVVSCA